MNNNAINPNYTTKDAKIHSDSIRACLLTIIPKRNSEHINVSEVWERMSRFLAENKRLEIVFDFAQEKNSAREVYQDKAPNRLDAVKVIKKMRELDCHVLIIPTFATLAENAETSSDILMELHEAGIRIVSPYDAFDSKVISKQVDQEATELYNDLQKALHQVVEKCIVKNVDEFKTYFTQTNFKHKDAPFCVTYGNKALILPYSERLRAELFGFLDFLDEEFLRPELYDDDEYNDEDDEDNDLPPYEHEPLVERDFEG